MNSMIGALRSAARKRRSYRNTVHELSAMSERQLSDIGVYGTDRQSFARRAVYGE